MSDPSDIQLSEVNEALLLSSIRQHELTEQAHLGESAALANQARFEALFEASPVGMYLVDSQLRIRLASRKARRTFGDDQDVIGRDFVEVIHAVWPQRCADDIVAHFRATLETGEPYIVTEFSEQRRDRKAREFYDWQIHRIVMPAGDYGVVCYFIDIADRVHAEQAVRNSEIRYRRLFEAAKDGILILNATDGSITDANPIVVEMLGTSRDELLGKHLWEIGLLSDARAGQAMLRDVREKNYLHCEHIPLRNAVGREIEVEVVVNVYAEVDHSIIQCNIRDITERGKSEKALVKALIYADDIIATLREPFLVLDDGLRPATNRSTITKSNTHSRRSAERRCC
jgi:PAS domain S-box-containing protein